MSIHQIVYGFTLPPSKNNTSYKACGDAVQWLMMRRSGGRRKSKDASQSVNV